MYLLSRCLSNGDGCSIDLFPCPRPALPVIVGPPTTNKERQRKLPLPQEKCRTKRKTKEKREYKVHSREALALPPLPRCSPPYPPEGLFPLLCIRPSSCAKTLALRPPPSHPTAALPRGCVGAPTRTPPLCLSIAFLLDGFLFEDGIAIVPIKTSCGHDPFGSQKISSTHALEWLLGPVCPVGGCICTILLGEGGINITN